MSVDEPQTEREWLIRIDGKVDKLLVCQEDHESRIRNVENRQLKWLGRDGAIVAGISGAFATFGIIISMWRS